MDISLFENILSSSKAYAFYPTDFGVTSSLEISRYLIYFCMWAFKLTSDSFEPFGIQRANYPRKLH